MDGTFNTDPDFSETYGHDLASGAAFTEEEYRAKEPCGCAFLHAADYEPPPESTSDEFPLLLTTGRTVYQFHTRTKTGRAPQLNGAAPDSWVELSDKDAAAVGVTEGDIVRVESRRGALEGRVRISGVRPGVVFVPFHYGDWDLTPDIGPGDGDGHAPRAANEVTITAWDPVSKQPLFKVAAVRVTKIAASGGRPSPAPTVGAPAPLDPGDVTMHLAHYLGLLHKAEDNLARAFRDVGNAHTDEPDVSRDCERIARQCATHVDKLGPFVDRYGENAPDEPDRLHADLFQGTRSGGLGLLRDLQDLYLMACQSDISWTMISQAAQGVRDTDLLDTVKACEHDTAIQLAWIRTRMKTAAPQALVVAS